RLHRRTSKNSSLCHRRSLLTIEEALCHYLQQTRTISETEPSHPSPSLQTRKPLKVKFSQILIQDMKRIRRGTTEASSSRPNRQRPTASVRRQRAAPQDHIEDTTEVEDVVPTDYSNVDTEVEDVATTQDSN
ncbi:unnamed protein product, partial [Prunus brigantina]